MLYNYTNSLITKWDYFRIVFKKNKGLVLRMGGLKIRSVHDIIEILVPIAYLHNRITA